MEFATGESGNLTLSDLEKTMEFLSRPVISRVWVVDMPGVCHSVLAQLSYPTDSLGFMRIPIVNFQTAQIDPGENIIAGQNDDRFKLVKENPDKKVWPWWCAAPGVWLEMSNGTATSFLAGMGR